MTWTALIDERHTRRLTLHRLFDENGNPVSIHQRLGELFEAAIARDIRRLDVQGPDGHWLIDIEPFPF